MKRKNILRSKKYMNQKSHGKVFEKRLHWLNSHVSLHLKGIWDGKEYDSKRNSLSLCPVRGTKIAPHIHWATDSLPWEPSVIIYQCIDDDIDETQFIDEQVFLTHRSDTFCITNDWVRTFWLR